MAFLQLPQPEFSAEQARDTADRVLSGRAYTQADRPPSLQERAFDWLAARVGDLFNALSTTGGRGALAWIVIGLFVALIVFLLSRLLRNLDPLPARAGAPRAEIAVVEGMTRAQWLAEAHAAERNGDFRSAIRCRHRALVAVLLDRRIAHAGPGFTAGEIAGSVARSQPIAQPAMDQLTAIFDDTWYGHRLAGAQDYTRFAELVETVESAVERSRHAPDRDDRFATGVAEPATAASGTR